MSVMPFPTSSTECNEYIDAEREGGAPRAHISTTRAARARQRLAWSTQRAGALAHAAFIRRTRLLLGLLQPSCAKLQSYCELVSTRGFQAASQAGASAAALESLHEELDIVVRCAGHLLADEPALVDRRLPGHQLAGDRAVEEIARLAARCPHGFRQRERRRPQRQRLWQWRLWLWLGLWLQLWLAACL